MTGRKPEGASSESESEAEDGAGKSPGKKVICGNSAYADQRQHLEHLEH